MGRVQLTAAGRWQRIEPADRAAVLDAIFPIDQGLVLTWARRTGRIPLGRSGPVPADVLTAYLAEHPTHHTRIAAQKGASA